MGDLREALEGAVYHETVVLLREPPPSSCAGYEVRCTACGHVGYAAAREAGEVLARGHEGARGPDGRPSGATARMVASTADRFAESLTGLPASEREGWIAYMLEVLEAGVGRSAVVMARDVAADRLERGSW